MFNVTFLLYLTYALPRHLNLACYDILFLLNLHMNVVGVYIVMNGAPGIVKLVYVIIENINIQEIDIFH